MKRLIIGVVTVISLVLGIFFMIFPDPFNFTRHESKNLGNQPEELMLVKNRRQGSIHSISVEITGEIDGKGVIKEGYSYSSFFRIDTIEDKFNLQYGGDWYQDTCFFKYEPITSTKGEISIDYKFFGMNN